MEKKYLRANYQPIDYNSLLSKDKEAVKLFEESIKKNRMVVISSVPDLEKMRKDHFKICLGLNNVQPSPADTFTNGIKIYNNLISFMTPLENKNFHSSNEEIQNKLRLFPDHNSKSLWPNIPNFKESSEQIAAKAIGTFKELFSIIENETSENSFLYNLNNSEKNLTRTIIVKPREENEESENSPAILWHYDIALFSIHIKDYYFNENFEEVKDVNEGGIIFRDVEGNDYRLELKEDEIMLQAGITMQVLSSNKYQAQAHKVDRPPKGIGRISNIVFVQPMFETQIMPFEKNYSKEDVLKMLEPHDKDKELIRSSIKFSNHWYENVPWIEFSQNQYLQFNLAPSLARMGYACEIKLYRWKTEEKNIISFDFDKIDSTHLLALDYRNCYIDENYLTTFTAEEQTGGIGQGKNSWTSPKGNLYFTCVTRAKFSSLLPQTTALAAKEALETFTENKHIFQMKWMNDLFYKDKKIAGILISSSTIEDSDLSKIIISIGVNLNEKTVDTATYLKEITNIDVDVISFRNVFIEKLTKWLSILQNDPFSIVKALNINLLYQNTTVNIYDTNLQNVLMTGTFIGVNEYGNALLEVDGKLVTVTDGRMRQLKPI